MTITSSSARSRAYLPATNRYGLMTPPDGPDTLDEASAKPKIPADDNIEVATPCPAGNVKKAFKIPRKPVNSPPRHPSNKPATQALVLDYSSAKRDARDTEINHAQHSSTSADSHDILFADNEVDVGCFGRGDCIHRLKDAISNGIKSVKELRVFSKETEVSLAHE